MSQQFATLDAARQKLGDERVVNIVNAWLEHRAQQTEYHAKYTKRKAEALKRLKALEAAAAEKGVGLDELVAQVAGE